MQCSECDQYLNLSEGADRVGGQLHGDKECPFSGTTKSGRVWRKVPESDARSVTSTHTSCGRKHRLVFTEGRRCNRGFLGAVSHLHTGRGTREV